ncbi:MAG: insulinase family protein [Planctomycetes bacterium]|jgi:predicted Zn-dependent peptidase|nr:insulinase family protein [Planctomycetota bacterium]MCL4730712.1 insulinase family protein [Planctomycetota bacterium]
MIARKPKLSAVKSRRLDETRHEAVLSCGMKLIFAPRPGFEKRIAYVVADFGSINTHWLQDGREYSVPGGIAHFLEHQLFKKKSGDLTDRFSGRGAYCNAHTSHTQTAYYFECVRYFEENLDTLMELALTPFFDRRLVDIERDIIIQEINQYLDHPHWQGYQQLLQSLYVNHPLRVDIAGTEAMVREIGPEQLQRCHAAWYHPTNLTLIVCGDMKPADVLRMADAAASRYAPDTPAPRISPQLPPEPGAVAAPRAERRMFVARPRLLLGFKDPGAPEGRELARLDLVSGVALDALFSRESEAYERLYAAGLIGGDFGAGYQAEKGFGYAVIGGETSDPDALYRELLMVLDDARARGVDAGLIERKRRKFLGGYLRAFNDPESTAYAYLGALGQRHELFDVPALADSITAEQVNARIQEMFDPARRAASIILPQAG